MISVSVSYQYHKTKWEPESDISDPLHHLTLEQKLYVSQKEVTETQQDLEKLRQTYEKINDDYKVTTRPCLEKQTIKKGEERQHKLRSVFVFPGLPERGRIASGRNQER